jgi:Ca2+/H+ antiporter
VLLPSAYLIGLIFTLKTHSHIYDIQVSDVHDHHQGQCPLGGASGEPINHKSFSP